MPGRWVPCPVKRNAVFPRPASAVGGAGWMTAGSGSPVASAVECSPGSSSRSAAMRAARWSNAARAWRGSRPMSARSRSGWPARWACRPAAWARQGRLRLGRHQPRPHHGVSATPPRRCRLLRRRRGAPARTSSAGCFLEDHVGVGAADAERGHSRPPRAPSSGPATAPPRVSSSHRTRRPVHMRRRLVHVQRPRQQAMPHRHAPS